MCGWMKFFPKNEIKKKNHQPQIYVNYYFVLFTMSISIIKKKQYTKQNVYIDLYTENMYVSGCSANPSKMYCLNLINWF